MISKKIKSKKLSNTTLLKSKFTNSNTITTNSAKSNKLKKTNKSTKSAKSAKSKKTSKLKHKKRHIIDKYCGYYKTDINGKINKNLYNSCKKNKYCRKYRCQDIDYKMIKAKQKNIGFNYNKIIFDKIKESCNQNIISDDDIIFKKKNRKCQSNTIKQLFKDNNMEELYNKSKECDKIICSKEQKIFNQNLFRQKQIQLKNSQIQKIKENDLKNEVDMDLIQKGDL